MRYFRFPSPIAINGPDQKPAMDPNGEPVVSKFEDFITKTVTLDQKFGQTMAALLARENLIKAIADKSPGDVVQLADSDWEFVRDVVKAPSSPYVPFVAGQILPFMHAICEAKTESSKLEPLAEPPAQPSAN